MCDYSLHHVSSRPAKIGDRLTTRNFHAGTLGFAAPEDKSVAVCVLPGTELSFADEVTFWPDMLTWHDRVIEHKTAIFRQVNLDRSWAHHDALEFPDGQIVLLTHLTEGQQATSPSATAAAVGSKAAAPERAASFQSLEIVEWLTL